MKAVVHATAATLVLTGIAAPGAANPGGTASVGVRAEVLDLRVGLTPERTRMVFDVSVDGSYRVMRLQDPARVAIDFPAAEARFDHRKVALGGTPVSRIRSAEQPDGRLRYVFDLQADVTTKVFALKPNGQAGNRVVIDMYETTPPAADAGGTSETALRPLTPSAKRRPSQSTPDDATRVPNPVSDGSPGHWSGVLSLQSRLFFQDPAYPDQDSQNASIALEPEYFIDWQNGRQRFALRPFLRYDANDSERSHADLRELYWRIEGNRLVFKAGIDVVFWGVTESQHLVDIINQTDLVENIDTEDKLGQPMLNLDYLGDWGTWQAWVLPYFRERTFPGENGRLRTQPAVDASNPLWDSGDEEQHIDYALRWSHYLGDWDIGLAHFTGTGRTPWFVPGGTPDAPTLRPLYLQIDQTSLDVQATKGAWLWKLETLYNQNRIEDYFALVGGFEYTWFGARNSAADLGWLLEYHYDERGEMPQVALQNDLFAGLRLTGNDIAGSRLLAGLTVDLDNGSAFGNVEAVRRIGESWTITLEARTFFNTDRDDPLHFLRRDDYLELQLDRYF